MNSFDELKNEMFKDFLSLQKKMGKDREDYEECKKTSDRERDNLKQKIEETEGNVRELVNEHMVLMKKAKQNDVLVSNDLDNAKSLAEDYLSSLGILAEIEIIIKGRIMFPNIFENAKVGDLVFWTTNGWCKIVDIRHGRDFPIAVEVIDEDGDPDETDFTLCGRRFKHDKFPTLFPEDKVPQYYLDLCPRPKRKVKKTLEIWTNVYPHKEYFSYFSEELANKQASTGRIACVKMIGEYEEEE